MRRPHQWAILFLFKVSAFQQRQTNELKCHGPLLCTSLCLEGNGLSVS